MEQIIIEDRNLSASETVIMKAIWDADGDISLGDLIEVINGQYKKNYARTTIVTFILHLSNKGFVVTYRNGRKSYVRAIKDQMAYKQKMINEFVEFWYDGDHKQFLSDMYSDYNSEEFDVEC